MIIRSLRAAVLAVASSLAAVIATPQAGAADLYGALAHNPDTGAYGFSYDHASRVDAIQRSLKECGKGCATVLEFTNACGAYATGSGTSYGWGRGASRGVAQTFALNECGKRGGACTIKVWGCTSRLQQPAAQSADTADIEGSWRRVVGGSQKGLNVRGAVANYDVKWRNRYDGFRNLRRLGPRKWSCEAIYLYGSIGWTKDCVARVAKNGRLIIDFSYPGTNRHLEFVRN